jgi:plastocyanin
MVNTLQMKLQEIEIQIDYFSFIPADVTVAPGATITWLNFNDAQHTVSSTDRTFNSRVLGTGEKFMFTFHTPGIYEYHCSMHPRMRGRVVVGRSDR